MHTDDEQRFFDLAQRVEVESKEVHDRMLDANRLLEQLIDNHQLLMGGLQTVTATNERINGRIDTLVLSVAGLAGNHGAVHTSVRWVSVIVVLLLAWQIGESVLDRSGAVTPETACYPPVAVASAAPPLLP